MGQNEALPGAREEKPEGKTESKQKKSQTGVGYWTLTQDNFDTLRIEVDTALHGLHVYNPIYQRSISNNYLGNLGSPYQSNIYFDRPQVDFMFSDVYSEYMITPSTLPVINTFTPFSILSYAKGGEKQYAEETVSGLFSQNVNEGLNIGFYFDILYSIGYYESNSTRHKNYGGFASYMKPRYNAYFNIGLAKLENYENGGIGSADEWIDEYISDPNSEDIITPINTGTINFPVRISSTSSQARSFLKHSFITLNHKYNLGVLREIEVEDTTSQEKQFVSAVNIVHQFKYETNVKQYEDDIAVTSFYNNAYIDSSYTLDSLRSRNISNRIGLYLDEGINKYGKFGLGGYIQMDNMYIANTPWTSIEDSTLAKEYSDWSADNADISLDSAGYEFINNYNGYRYNNVLVGGSIFKRTGTHFFFDASSQLCIAGYNSGDWKLDGEIRQVFPNMGDWEVTGHISLDRKTPDYIQQTYYSNNFWWNNDFDASTKQSIGGTLNIPSFNFDASIDVENIQDYVYYNTEGLPAQYSSNLAVLSVRVNKDFEIGKHLVWENKFVYQETSNDEVLPLPEFTIYSNFYFRHTLFDVLDFELGVDCRYNTAYYAPGYMPATGRFYNQRDVQIGNYPMMNVYADFFLRRMRFYVMGTHINYGWPSLDYFSAPHYGYNQRMFKFGLQWTFYD